MHVGGLLCLLVACPKKATFCGQFTTQDSFVIGIPFPARKSTSSVSKSVREMCRTCKLSTQRKSTLTVPGMFGTPLDFPGAFRYFALYDPSNLPNSFASRGFSRDRGGDAGDVAALSLSFWACLVRILKTYKGIPSPQNESRLESSTIVTGVMNAHPPVFLQTTRNSTYTITGMITVVFLVDGALEHLSDEV
ncbi:hypothetical protein C8Q78DRAFT_987247 [Trametes maxima]|nr:hypothetical protein C8Q78DRAFT_987247 [Trametes maxima]